MVYKASIQWDGKRRDITVLAADGGALVGMNLLKGAHVSMNIVDGGAVTIEPKVEE